MARKSSIELATVALTDRATIKIKEYIQKEGKNTQGLRVKAERDECNCLTYSLELEEKSRDDDVVFEEKGLKIFVDPASAKMVQGATIDYVKTSKSEGFRISGGECGPGCGCSS